jgi:hypothetical protein
VAPLLEIDTAPAQDGLMQRWRAALLVALSIPLTAGTALRSQAGPAPGWTVAIPPYRTVGATVVADVTAPESSWVRHGEFATEAACKAEIKDEATRAEVASRMVDSVGAGLTDALRGQVLEAVRHARCVPRSN